MKQCPKCQYVSFDKNFPQEAYASPRSNKVRSVCACPKCRWADTPERFFCEEARMSNEEKECVVNSIAKIMSLATVESNSINAEDALDILSQVGVELAFMNDALRQRILKERGESL